MEGKSTEPAKLVGGRYALESLLGTGGMGEVWRARHVALNTLVAIKFLHGTSAQRLSTRKRFLTEAQVTAQLKTRHAVQVFDFGVTDDGQPYLVMELLDGETLGHRITRQTRLPVATTVRFLEQAARALERAHAVGIVHRDFKPDNIVISLDEEGKEHVKVLDFGIAKLLNELEADSVEDDREASTDLPPPHAKAFATFTKTGTILGTPLYMSPEQVRNSADLDLRADIWAFGVVAFQCLTGVPPFEGKNLIQLFEKITTGIHPRARSINRELPAGFDEWFDIACAPDATNRFASAKAAVAALGIALEVRDAVPNTSVPPDLASGPDMRDSQSITDERLSYPNGQNLLASAAAHAATLDAKSGPTSSGIVSSQRRAPTGVPTPDRLGRMPSSRPPGPNGARSAEPEASVSDSAERVLSTRARRQAILLALGIAAAIAIFATWRVGVRREQISMPVTTATVPATPSAVPPSTAIPSAAATETPLPPPTASTSTAAASTRPIASHARPPQMPDRPVGISPSTPATSVATPTPTASVTAAPLPPRPSAPPASAASPFNLPPLGI